jgi:photosystem II stability/assembly factor-like uncharacterized protein
MRNIWLVLGIIFFRLFFSAELFSQSTSIRVVSVGTDALLQAYDRAEDGSLWVSGHKGTFGISADQGETWSFSQVKEAESLEFRDVEAFSSKKALLMSAGEGEKSSIWITKDGGSTWDKVFQMDHPQGFLDCMSFWDEKRGVVYGDSFEGKHYVLLTQDGGETWSRIPASSLPNPLTEEGGFAASGTCVCTGSEGEAFIGTSSDPARVLVTSDYGNSWTALNSPMGQGEFSGITSVVAEGGRLWVFGGNLSERGGTQSTAWFTEDQGKSWKEAGSSLLQGAVYGGAVLNDVVIQSGPGGLAISRDKGKTFQKLSELSFWASGFISEGHAIALGPQGRLALISYPSK